MGVARRGLLQNIEIAAQLRRPLAHPRRRSVLPQSRVHLHRLGEQLAALICLALMSQQERPKPSCIGAESGASCRRKAIASD